MFILKKILNVIDNSFKIQTIIIIIIV